MTAADAVVAVAQSAVSVSVFDTIIPDQPQATRWVAVYPDEGTFLSLELCNPGQQGVVRWQVNCFAPSRQQAAFLSGKIRDRFLSGWVSVPGWSDASVEHELAVQARPDESVRSVPLVVCSDLYSMTITKV